MQRYGQLNGYIMLALLILTVGSLAQTNGIISDAVIIPPEYQTFVPPSEVGSSYVDPAFGTRIYRVTNCGNASPDAFGGYFGNSEICVFNVDGSYFIAVENVEEDGKDKLSTFLYNGITGTRIKYLGEDTIRPWWIRWAIANKYKKNGEYVTFDPVYCFYKYEGNEVRLYDVRDMQNYVVLHKFDEYSEIGPAGGEGDISDDGRYWCLDGDGRELFVYDLIDDIKYPTSTFDLGSLGSFGGEIGVDYAAVSPMGNYVVVAWTTQPAEERYHGIEVYDKEWNFIRQVHPGIVHWEVGVDAFGSEVVYTVAGFSIPEYFTSRGVNPGDVISIRMSDGYMRLLKHMESWAPPMMTACNSVTSGKYLYVSFSARSDDPESVWAPFWGEIVEIPTDGSGEVRRLVHHRSREVDGKTTKYWQADAVINRQGTKILYRSTYGGSTADLYFFDVGSRNDVPSDTVRPNEPMNLRNSSRTFNSIELEWDRPTQAEDGDYASFYRVFRDDIQIAETFETRFLDSGLEEATTYKYDVYAVDKAGNTSLAPASEFFTTLSDTIPPRLLSVHVKNQHELNVVFSEPIEKISAENPTNYTISNQVDITQAVLADDSVTVTLETSPMSLGIDYIITVRDVYDISKNHNVIADGSSLSFRLLSDFFDGFDDGLSDSWKLLHPERWSIASVDGDNTLYLNTSDYDSPGGKLLGEYALIDQSQFFSAEFRLNCEAKSAEDLNANAHADYAIVFNYLDSLNYYYVQFHSYDVSVNEIVNGDRTFLSKYSVDVALDQMLPIGIKMQRDTLTVYVNNEPVYSQYLQLNHSGQIGVGSYNDAVYFDNINLEAIKEQDTTAPAPPSGIVLTPIIR